MTQEYENSLRMLIIDILGENNYSAYQVSDERIDKWLERRNVELKKNNGILLENRLIYYSDFYDLRLIIHKNWEQFKPILKDKKRFEVFFSEVENYRDTIAHGRNLTTGQENLLNGITSDLKNLFTFHHNKNENKDDYFIRILKVTDNLGNNLMKNFFPPHPLLRVGEEYEVIVEANDPKGRKIEYEITAFGGLKITQFSNRFIVPIKKEYVAQSFTLSIHARTPDSEYLNETAVLS